MDGVHMRRMWMLNNPVVLVRAMLDPGTKLSSPHQASGITTIDVTLKQGDKLTAAFTAEHMPAWVRWSHPQTNLGQANLTTTFTGWSETSGLMMPLAYQTRLDFRNIDFFKLYVDAYDVDSTIADLAAPAAVALAPEPPSLRRAAGDVIACRERHLARQQRDDGDRIQGSRDALRAWRQFPRAGERPSSIMRACLVPGKPVTQLIISHHHFDHTAGFREAVAEGLTIMQRADERRRLREMATHAAPDFPDDLAKNPNA
jgi:hypothetical protein